MMTPAWQANDGVPIRLVCDMLELLIVQALQRMAIWLCTIQHWEHFELHLIW